MTRDIPFRSIVMRALGTRLRPGLWAMLLALPFIALSRRENTPADVIEAPAGPEPMPHELPAAEGSADTPKPQAF